jgi:hypothetical protein
VELAARAAGDMVAGRPIHTDELVISLRDFIREALDLDPIPADVAIPKQGPARVIAQRGKGDGAKGEGGGKGGGAGGGMGGGMAAGAGAGLGAGSLAGDEDGHHH